MIEELVDVDPINIKSTWWNKRPRFASVSKRLDGFLAGMQLLQNTYLIRSWLGIRGGFDHNMTSFNIIRLRKTPLILLS